MPSIAIVTDLRVHDSVVLLAKNPEELLMRLTDLDSWKSCSKAVVSHVDAKRIDLTRAEPFLKTAGVCMVREGREAMRPAQTSFDVLMREDGEFFLMSGVRKSSVLQTGDDLPKRVTEAAENGFPLTVVLSKPKGRNAGPFDIAVKCAARAQCARGARLSVPLRTQDADGQEDRDCRAPRDDGGRAEDRAA